MINDFLKKSLPEEFLLLKINFSGQTSTNNILDQFLDKDKFIKKKKDLISPAGLKKMLLFIDDINMPIKE